MNADLQARLLDLYPVLGELPPSLRADTLAHHVWHVHAPAGTVLFTEGAPCRGFPMVLHGTVRVACGSQGGRSLELYRVTPGEMCVISTTCLFGQAPLSAEGVALEPTDLMLLSAAGFSALGRDEAFRRYAFGTLAERIAQLMALVEAVAFQRLDRRLAAALLGHGSVVAATHQDLADEVGTVREIVTRLLRRFEASGHLRIGRGRIELLAPAALRRIAEGRDGDPGH
jgi:CRP/FNR family transcriptional regulator